VNNLKRTLASWIVAVMAACAWTGPAVADGYRGAPFSAEAWFGSDGALELRYKLYVGAKGYRLEAVKPVEGPDIIIAQFAVPQFVYIDLNTGSVNLLPMGENDWGRYHGIACADFEYRKKLGAAEVGGKATEVWQCIGSTRYLPDSKIWWDPALRYQVRSDEQGYITELRNIKPGEPDAALFDVPPAPN
jgi:hypothetical protein